MNKYFLFFIFELLVTIVFSQTQKIKLENYSNKARAYAILSAQFTKDAYFFTEQNIINKNNTKEELIKNCRLTIKFCDQAILYADTAIQMPKDSNIANLHAERVMSNARKNQLMAISLLEKILDLPYDSIESNFFKKPMYYIDNAIVEAYAASIDFNGDANSKRNSPAENSLSSLNEINSSTFKDSKRDGNFGNKDNNQNNNRNNAFDSIGNSFADNIDNKNLTYRIQLGIFKRRVPMSYFDKLEKLNIFEERIGGLWRYSVGNFKTYMESKLTEQIIEQKGFDAFVFPMINNLRIHIEKGLEMEIKKSDKTID